MGDITTQDDGTTIINSAVGLVGLHDIAEFITANIDSWIGKPVLWDLSEMDFHDVQCEELRVFVKAMAPLSAKRAGEKTGLVAPQDVQFGMMRAFGTFAEIALIRIQFRVFREIGDAREWLSAGNGQ